MAVVFAQGIQPHHVWSRGSCDPSRWNPCRSRLRPHRLRAAGSVPGVPVAVRQEAAVLERRERRRAPSGRGVRRHGLLELVRPCLPSAARPENQRNRFHALPWPCWAMTVTTTAKGQPRSNGDCFRQSLSRAPSARFPPRPRTQPFRAARFRLSCGSPANPGRDPRVGCRPSGASWAKRR